VPNAIHLKLKDICLLARVMH